MAWDALQSRLYKRPHLREDHLEECVRKVVSPKNFPHDEERRLEQRRQKWTALLRSFQAYGAHSTGNRVRVLEGGDVCFAEMLDEISAAKSRVWCESYIFDNSPVARQFVEALVVAARRGCDVILLVDYIGSFSMSSEWLEELQLAGAETAFFNPVLPSQACVGPISFRDHRKIMICDDVGFCGGMNIHEEVGEERFGTSKFYDVHARLEGPCVADLGDVLLDSLQETGSGIVRQPLARPPEVQDGVYVQVLQSNVRKQRRTLQSVITGAIHSADDKVFLTTAYFFPPGFLRRALTQVPSRGASLSVLLSGSSDFYPLPGDLLAQTHFLRRFLRETRGHEEKVSVHLYAERHMHAKHMSVDGVFSTIGSFNFDLYSARRNLEVGVSVFDDGFARDIEGIHKRKVKESLRTSLADWPYHHPLVRLACFAAYTGIRLSGRNLFDGLDCFQQKWLVRKASLTFLLEEQAAQFVATSMMWGM